MPTSESITVDLLPVCQGFLLRRAKALGLSLDHPAHLDRLLNAAIYTSHFPTMKYLLLDHNQQPKACDIREWADWQATDPDIGVNYTVVGDAAVGTKFISILPHEHAPCWETDVVGGMHHGLREVCSGNREQAEQMHATIVQRVRSASSIPPKK